MLIDTKTGRGKEEGIPWWIRESEQKFRSWESTVFGGAVFETQSTLGQLKSPNTVRSTGDEGWGIGTKVMPDCIEKQCQLINF